MTKDPKVVSSEASAHVFGHANLLSCSDFYELVRAQVYHEDELINYRLSWLIQSQSIFLAAYAIVLTSKPELLVFRFLMIVVSLAITASISAGVYAAIEMMTRCVKQLDTHCKDVGHDVRSLPSLNMSDRVHLQGMHPAQRLPLFFAITWILILIAFAFHIFHPLPNEALWQ